MKSLLATALAFLLVAIIVLGFAKKEKPSITIQKKSDIIYCGPLYSGISNATAFVIQPNIPLVRKNVYNINATEVNSLKLAIAKMKQLSISNPNDPTGWEYQAAIHGTLVTPTQLLWNSCQHGSAGVTSLFFLSWHRMFLFYFERILRAKSGNPNFTLPYWNYQLPNQKSLPPIFCWPAANTNPLYEPSRYYNINTRTATLPSSIGIDLNSSLKKKCFTDFQSLLDAPHGNVHISIGGKMSDIETAAQDPIFWLHHANIDRLWEAWIKQGAGRNSPSFNSWLNQSFTFYDFDGTAKTMTGNQVINTAAQLNYTYDAPSTVTIPNNPPATCTEPVSQQALLRSSSSVSLQPGTAQVSLQSATAPSSPVIPGPYDRLYLEIENVTITKLPEGVIELYFLADKNEPLVPESKSYAGLINLFSLTSPHHTNVKPAIRIDITAIVGNPLQLIKKLKKSTIAIRVRGNTDMGKEIVTKADIDFSGFNIVLEKRQ